MTIKERVSHAVFSAVDEINQQLSTDHQLEKTADTILLGELGRLDSLGIVNILVTTEQTVEDEFDISITLLEDNIAADNYSHLRSIGDLINYISLKLENNDVEQ